MQLKYLQESDWSFAVQLDSHMNERAYMHHVQTGTGCIIWDEDVRIGLLHWCIFWDHIPFLNFICILPEYRNRGHGSRALNSWETEMREAGFKMVLVSTQADEQAQFLYRRQGYVDCGGLVFTGTPFAQPTELFLRKVL